jgi:prepilin-type N-terminal cleavage/methylation domain-containing protein
MIHVIQSEPPGSRRRAFTLVEIVVSLTVVAVIAAVAIPTLKGLNRDEKARRPIISLAEIVQEARHRAMRERRSYQIVFEPGGIHASPAMYPYEKLDDFLKHLEELRTPPEARGIAAAGVERQTVVRDGAPEPAAPPAPRFEPPWTLSIPLESGTECGVLMWGDGEWDVLDGGKMRRWVFQPAGMSNPARVRLRRDGKETQAGFDVLTGELTSERTALVSRQP